MPGLLFPRYVGFKHNSSQEIFTDCKITKNPRKPIEIQFKKIDTALFYFQDTLISRMNAFCELLIFTKFESPNIQVNTAKINISWEETFIFECFYRIMTDEFSGLIMENERIFFYVKSTDIY